MRILITSNCQSYGLANSIMQLVPGAQVKALPGRLIEDGRHKEDLATSFDVVFGLEGYRQSLSDNTSADLFLPLPALYFDRFHPDTTAVVADNNPLLGPTDTYHSLIIFAAYMSGRNTAATSVLFNAKTFETLGYLSGWNSARNQLFADYTACGLDVRAAYMSWISRGSFMMSNNHPRIFTLFSTAKLLLEKAGIPTLDMDECLVPDNLMNASILPVYPEIAEQLGFKGSRIFKLHNVNRTMDLDTYIAKSFALYDQYADKKLEVRMSMQPAFNRMKEILA